MKTTVKLITTAALILATALTAFATEFTKGKIKKIDEKAGKVTIIHEELKNLDMPPMTMVFRIGDGVDTTKLKPGADIEFVADRVNGKITLTQVK